MFSAINFIKERRKLLTKKRQKDKKIFLYAVAFFATVLIASLSLIGVNLFLSHKVKSQDQAQAKLKQILAQSQSVQLKYRLNIVKLKIVAKLFGARKNKQEAVNYFSNLFDPDVRISSISYDENKQTLSFTLYIPSVFKLEKVLLTLDSSEVHKKVSKLEKGNVSRSGDGSYSLSVKVGLGDKNNFK